MNIKLPLNLNLTLKEKILHFIKISSKDYWITNTTLNTKNRFFCKISEIQNLPLNLEINELKKNVFNSVGIYKFLDEHIFGNFIGINKEGGNVHNHTDPSYNGLYHTRINFLLQKPFLGGLPIINSVEYNLEENECWFNNASLWQHGSSIVKGNRDRIVLSLGAYIDPQDFELVNKNILKNI